MNSFVGQLPQTMTQMSKNNNIKTHPSVRIRGTETNFTPVQCLDPTCSNKNPHSHCPFCVKSESYQDPVILKAHYRVKHVDKGIEFTGLKILRCCDHCELVGIIKGEKKFKRAHWHCYKCQNGFNRRDEAIKHYKTHFRNPQTTFQIQIAQEVNQVSHLAATHTISQEEVTTHPVLADATILSSSNSEQHTFVTRTTGGSLTNGKSNDGAVHVSVAANETVDTTDSQTIMFIKEDITNINNSFATQIISSEDITSEKQYALLQDKHAILQDKYAILQDKYDQLAVEKAQMEQDYNTEIEHLKSQIQILNRDLSNYQKREQELLGRLCPPDEKSISKMVQEMEEQYRNLIDSHLAQLRSTYLSNLPTANSGQSTVETAASSAITTSSSNDAGSPLASATIVEAGQVESDGAVEYETTTVAATLEQQEQEVEVNGSDDVEALQRQQQEQLAYIANKVVARLKVSNFHNGSVHDDIVIITSNDHVRHTQEEGVVNNEPLIICTQTVEEATMEQTVSCHTTDPTEETTTTVVSEGDPLEATVSEELAKEVSETQVLSSIHTSSATSSQGETADEQQKQDVDLPPTKRLRTET